MNRTQKIAGFNLIVILIALTLSAIAVSVFYFVVDLPIGRALGGFGFMGITGLMGLSPFLYKKERGKVSFDERDALINYRAVLAADLKGSGAVFTFFILPENFLQKDVKYT